QRPPPGCPAPAPVLKNLAALPQVLALNNLAALHQVLVLHTWSSCPWSWTSQPGRPAPGPGPQQPGRPAPGPGPQQPGRPAPGPGPDSNLEDLDRTTHPNLKDHRDHNIPEPSSSQPKPSYPSTNHNSHHILEANTKPQQPSYPGPQKPSYPGSQTTQPQRPSYPVHNHPPQRPSYPGSQTTQPQKPSYPALKLPDLNNHPILDHRLRDPTALVPWPTKALISRNSPGTGEDSGSLGPDVTTTINPANHSSTKVDQF
ncbi:uncharacterized protein LOC131807173, partial [Musca domestica]|uniref:Uncharacterized protein LOC131807173 n=1 Tax=Musca domestica TaxID=7370 RepID=A0ABM3VQV8_MUSDO